LSDNKILIYFILKLLISTFSYLDDGILGVIQKKRHEFFIFNNDLKLPKKYLLNDFIQYDWSNDSAKSRILKI